MPEGQGPPVDMAAVIERDIELDHRLFEETGNPMWAWSAIRTVTDYGLSIPDWLTEYLHDSAITLIGTSGQPQPPYGDRVLASLGFRRRPGTDDLSEYAARMTELKRGVQMIGPVHFRGMSPKKASVELEGELGEAKSFQRGWNRVKHLLGLMRDTK